MAKKIEGAGGTSIEKPELFPGSYTKVIWRMSKGPAGWRKWSEEERPQRRRHVERAGKSECECWRTWGTPNVAGVKGARWRCDAELDRDQLFWREHLPGEGAGVPAGVWGTALVSRSAETLDPPNSQEILSFICLSALRKQRNAFIKKIVNLSIFVFPVFAEIWFWGESWCHV